MRKIREGFVEEMELWLGYHYQFANRQTDTVTNRASQTARWSADHLFVLFFNDCLFIAQMFIEPSIVLCEGSLARFLAPVFPAREAFGTSTPHLLSLFSHLCPLLNQ